MQDQYLVVDLDGTLIRSDMSFETFWSAFSRRWTTPFSAARRLVQGRAALKQHLSAQGPVDAASLPYNNAVLDYIADWRARGGRTALVTASNQSVADCVAAHLGLFDEVHGSDASSNLRGACKASFLEMRFGNRGFDYMGDTAADIPVWEKASRAIMVNVPAAVRRRVAAFEREIIELPAQMPSVAPYLRVLRPHQWLKNTLIFLPLMAAHQLDLQTLGQAALAFVAFCLIASSVYVLNDLLDLGVDRAHPRKRNRPFASGAVPLSHGTVLAPLLLTTGLSVALMLGQSFVLTMLAYYIATTAYSLYFKRQALIDICLLAGLYTTRIVAGAVATDIQLSVWLLAFSIFFFFSLAAIKRQTELADAAATDRTASAGRGYRVEDLPMVMGMATASGYVSILVMGLYVNSPAVLELYANPPVLWGICLVLFYWINRVVMLTHRGEMHDDPVVFAATDRTSQLCFALILGITALGALS